ncbi:hypothetical protein [Burkholderia ambifaria]|uniref:hypothetical protein n=1 Tax=Burkholderia ambifaria TaxID=152480 RepID=UPI00158BAA17|nr:hypothetical protein [Burkholderia ambifaria]
MANRRLPALLADLVADRVVLPVQHVLFALRNVAAILRGPVPLFLADPAVVTVQARGPGVRLSPVVARESSALVESTLCRPRLLTFPPVSIASLYYILEQR